MAMQILMDAQNEQEQLEGRELEASVLKKAAYFLEDVKGHWQEDIDHAYLNAAIEYNQRLWSVFQGEMVEDCCPLPQDLRSNILSLSTFIDKRSSEVIACPAPDKLDILININRNLAEGLMTH